MTVGGNDTVILGVYSHGGTDKSPRLRTGSDRAVSLSEATAHLPFIYLDLTLFQKSVPISPHKKTYVIPLSGSSCVCMNMFVWYVCLCEFGFMVA